MRLADIRLRATIGYCHAMYLNWTAADEAFARVQSLVQFVCRTWFCVVGLSLIRCACLLLRSDECYG